MMLVGKTSTTEVETEEVSWLEPVSKTVKLVESAFWLLLTTVGLFFSFLIYRRTGFTFDVFKPILFFAIPVGVFGALRYRVKEVRRFQKERVEVDLGRRLGDSLPLLVLGVGGLSVAIWLLYLTNELNNYWPYTFFALFPTGLGIYFLVKTDRLELTAAAEIMKEGLANPVRTINTLPAAQTENLQNDVDVLFDAKWWVRYPIGCFALWLGYYFGFETELRFSWFLSAICWLSALGLMREAFLFALGGGALMLVAWGIGGIAAGIPVSLAIIIGALIIASSIKG